MGDSAGKVAIHSLTEGQLYLWVTPCPRCGQGSLVPGPGVDERRTDGDVLAVPVTCRPCQERVRIDFALGPGAGVQQASADFMTLDQAIAPPPLPINPTDEASRAIDVAGWLTLEAMLLERARAVAARAEGLADRATVRLWQVLAGECIAEALKFYDEDNDLPPEDAFFSESSRRQFRERPALFARDRLIDLRARKPMAHSQRHASQEE
jgi:hypothetical protein